MAARAKRTFPSVPKLNLIPPHIRAARFTGIALAGSVVMFLLLLAPMILWWQRNASVLSLLDQEIRRVEPEVNEIRKMESDAQAIRGGVAVLTDRLQTLDEIYASGKTWSEGISRLSQWIPERVRLTSFQLTGSQNQASGVILVGYTDSVRRLAKLYGHLSKCPLLTGVTLEEFEWKGVRYAGGQMPPVVPKELQGAAGEMGILPAPGAGALPQVQAAPAGAAPPGAAPPGGPPPAAAPAQPAGGAAGQAPTMQPGAMAGPPGGGGPPGAGGGAGGQAPTMQPGQMAGPPAMPGGGMGMPMGGMPRMGGMGGMAGLGQQVAIVRDPTAPRNAVYFVIRANLVQPISVGTKLAAAAQPAAPAGGGMPMMGAMPMMGGMPGAGGPPGAGVPGAAPPAGGGGARGEEEEAGGGAVGGLTGRQRGAEE